MVAIELFSSVRKSLLVALSLLWSLQLGGQSWGMEWSEHDLRVLRRSLVKNDSVTTLHRNRCLQRSLKLDETFGDPIFVCPLKIEEKQWGNRVGEYFEAITCADIAGMHFINAATSFGNHSLYRAFPKVIRHHNPNNHTLAAATIFRDTCPGFAKYPYTDAGAWNQRLRTIKLIMEQVITKSFPKLHEATLPTSTFARLSFPDFTFPISVRMVPDAAILFRCKDVILSNSTNPYGFMNFNLYTAFLSHRNVSSIYILSEPLDYLNTQRYSDWRSQVCDHLSIKLMGFLKSQFPHAIIGLRRGFAADSIAILSHAKTVLCAPSTFCLWPGIVNRHTVYLSSSVMNFLPHISHTFFWIKHPRPTHFHDKVSPLNTTVDEAVSIIAQTLTDNQNFSFDVCSTCLS